MKNKAIGIVGLILISFIACLAIFAPLIAQYDPNAVVGPSYAKPSAEFLLGTNDVGYDIFSELVYGAQYSLLVGLTSAAIAAGIGIVVGVLSGWFGGMIDSILMKITSFFYYNTIFTLSDCVNSIFAQRFYFYVFDFRIGILAGNCPYLTFTNYEDA